MIWLLIWKSFCTLMKLIFTFLAYYWSPADGVLYLGAPPPPLFPFFFFFPFFVGLLLPRLLLLLKLLLIVPDVRDDPPFLFPFRLGETPPEVLIPLPPRDPLIIPEPTMIMLKEIYIVACLLLLILAYPAIPAPWIFFPPALPLGVGIVF